MRTGQRKFNRGRAAVVVCATLAAGFSTAVPAGVAAPDDPSIDEVRDRVSRLNHEAEQANERYLQLIDQIGDTRKDLKATRKDVRDQKAAFAKVKKRVTASLVADASDSPLGTTGELLTSDNPEKFIDGLGAMQAYNSTQNDLLADYTKTSAELGSREKQLTAQLDSIDDAKQKMADEKADVKKKADAAEDLLDTLEAEQREEVLNTADGHEDGPSRDEDRDPTVDSGDDSTDTSDASGAAAKAIEFAKAQLGDPYVYGATGPDSWDCSGLTSGAYASAGISLPRSSSSQAGVGTPVSTSDMQPGDLVFYYSPISHVGIYLGNGQLIHAPHSGASVEITGVSVMPIAAVRRVA
ncbi:NlpC/P60 family protein [Nocardioidaceae bacterium SCSIO 66511]|nr:NlpC/P60 family protein [Nocardioidaceae bacterium SCSIO 66511]